MRLPESFAVQAITASLAVLLLAAGGLALAKVVKARSADSVDTSAPIKRGTATHSGTGEPWNDRTNPAYDGHPYGR